VFLNRQLTDLVWLLTDEPDSPKSGMQAGLGVGRASEAEDDLTLVRRQRDLAVEDQKRGTCSRMSRHFFSRLESRLFLAPSRHCAPRAHDFVRSRC